MDVGLVTCGLRFGIGGTLDVGRLACSGSMSRQLFSYNTVIFIHTIPESGVIFLFSMFEYGIDTQAGHYNASSNYGPLPGSLANVIYVGEV